MGPGKNGQAMYIGNLGWCLEEEDQVYVRTLDERVKMTKLRNQPLCNFTESWHYNNMTCTLTMKHPLRESLKLI